MNFFDNKILEQMGRELDEILRQQIAQPANSCLSENGVSFLDQVVRPLYEVVAAVCFTINFPFPSLSFFRLL